MKMFLWNSEFMGRRNCTDSEVIVIAENVEKAREKAVAFARINYEDFDEDSEQRFRFDLQSDPQECEVILRYGYD